VTIHDRIAGAIGLIGAIRIFRGARRAHGSRHDPEKELEAADAEPHEKPNEQEQKYPDDSSAKFHDVNPLI
jgi:hypothetical protein